MEQITIKKLMKQKNNRIEKILFNDKNKKVFLIENSNDNQKYIIKEIDLSNLTEDQKNISLQEEVKLSKLKHPNILNNYGSDYINNSIMILFEYGEGGNLSNKIKNQNKIYFQENQIINWFIEICETIKFIHSKNYIYGELKPENIFLNKDNHIKIGNYCISTNKNINITSENIHYLSPEIIKGQYYDDKSDIWNLGIILYELTQLKHPFGVNNSSIESKRNNILQGYYSYFSNMKYSQELLDLIKGSLKVVPKERIEIDNILFECYKIKNKKNFFFNEV